MALELPPKTPKIPLNLNISRIRHKHLYTRNAKARVWTTTWKLLGHLPPLLIMIGFDGTKQIWWSLPKLPDFWRPPKASNIYFCSFYIAVFIKNKEEYRNEAQKLFCIVWNVKKFRENQFLHFCLFRDKKGIWFCVFGQVQ